jgi:hypothetical protein
MPEKKNFSLHFTACGQVMTVAVSLKRNVHFYLKHHSVCKKVVMLPDGITSCKTAVEECEVNVS